jgi:hypothetical protein
MKHEMAAPMLPRPKSSNSLQEILTEPTVEQLMSAATSAAALVCYGVKLNLSVWLLLFTAVILYVVA